MILGVTFVWFFNRYKGEILLKIKLPILAINEINRRSTLENISKFCYFL